MTSEEFDRAVKEKRSDLLKSAYSYLHDWDDAEDVVQEALICAWRYQPEGEVRNVGGLLYKHLGQRLSRFRKTLDVKDVPLTPELAAVHPELSVPDGTADLMAADEFHRAVKYLHAHAIESTRRAIVMHEFYDLPYVAISQALGIEQSVLWKRCTAWKKRHSRKEVRANEGQVNGRASAAC